MLQKALGLCQGHVLGAETEIRRADSAPRNSASLHFRLLSWDLPVQLVPQRVLERIDTLAGLQWDSRSA